MRVLVACEESQRVCIEFRRLGHEAFSCDIEPCSGRHPEWHIQGDVLPLLNGDCTFQTADTHTHTQRGPWDMIIGFPPCTNLAVSGARWFPEKQRDLRQQKSCVFFMYIALAWCKRVAVENPIGIMSTVYRKPDQIIQPWQYGHQESKKTCLWLRGLPKLQPTDILEVPENGIWKNQTKDGQNKLMLDGKWLSWNDPRTAKYRSKTYEGIARAMAEQWGRVE